MLRSIMFAFSLVLLCFFPLQAQTSGSRLLEELLNLPAPPPVSNPIAVERVRSADFYDKAKAPPDNAPLEDLLDYWAQNASANQLRYQPTPSDEALKRMLAEIENDPKKLLAYLPLLSGKPDEVELVKRLYNESEGNEKLEYGWRGRVREWLKYNSSLFSEELLNKARKVRDENGNTANERELLTLARVDWNAAEPLLERLLNDKNQPRAAVSALWAYYNHALAAENQSDAEKYRDQLKKIVSDRAALPSVRDKAMDALVLSPEWEGRDEWYLSLLDDETLFELKEGNSVYTGLTTLIAHSKPGKWTAAMTKLVGHQNPTIHNVAVRNLISSLEIENPDKDTLRTLLPWLSNPSWAKETQSERMALLRSLSVANLPEALPVLITLLTNEANEENRVWAAKALASYKDARAVPALKLALSKDTDHASRQELIPALIACGGLTDQEQMASLEAYAAQISTPEGLEKFEESESAPVEIAIGMHLSEVDEPSDSLAELFFERLKFWQKNNSAVADVLAGFVRKWKNRVIFAELLYRIETGKADVSSILIALARRADVREKASEALLRLRGARGAGLGIAAVLTEDEGEMNNVLYGKDAEARIALLAAARLLRAKLPVADVGAYLNDKNNLLALAAERYLEAEDSPRARELVLSKRPNEALILGARTAFVPGNDSSSYNEYLQEVFTSLGVHAGWQDFPELKKFEERLRAEAKANENLEIFAVLSDKNFEHTVVRVEKKRAVLTFYENQARYSERALTDKEFEALRVYLAEKDVENQLPVFQSCHHGCPSSEFVAIHRKGGRRVFLNGIPFNAPQPLKGLYELFQEFLSNGEFRQTYYLSEKIPGLEILFADDNLRARAVWKNDDGLRVLLEDQKRGWEILREIWEKQQKDQEAEIENAYQLGYQRRLASQYEHFSWRTFKSGKLGDSVAQPDEVPFIPARPETQDLNSASKIVQKAGNIEIRQGAEGEGLLKIVGTQAPQQIVKGFYSNPVVTPDGKWVAAAKAAENWYAPNGAVLINLQNGREFKINLPLADNFYPVAFIPAHGKILLYRTRDEAPDLEQMRPRERKMMEIEAAKNPSPKVPEYYLLDTATGATQLVKGEFRPLEQQTLRVLQPASQPNVYWAAIPEESETVVGLYDAKTFVFKDMLKLPSISFNSLDTVFDGAGGKFYFVHEGHLLALPLPKPEKAKESGFQK